MSKVPIGIIGLNFGRHIIDQIVDGAASDYIELAAVCDLDEEKAKDFSERFNVPYYTDMNDLLSNADIPAVGLYTGPGGRANLLNKILDAGKDVMTTKPFELDCTAALAVLRRAEKMGRVLHLNSPAPCLSPDLALVKDWHDKHDLGAAVGCQLSVWARYREEADGRWLDDPELCPVAPIFRLGIYLINDLITIFGEAEEVSVMSSRLFTGRPTPDNAQLSILFKNGALATIYASFCIGDGDFYRNSMVLHYENGTVYRNMGPMRGDVQGAEMALVMGSPEVPRHIQEQEVASETSGTYQWEAFAKAVHGEDIPAVVTPESVVAGLRVIEAMAKAEKCGGVAKVEPVE